MNADNHEQNPLNAAPKTSGWPIKLSELRNPPSWLANSATTLLILTTVLLLLLTAISVVRLTSDLLGPDQYRASEAVKSLLPIAAAAIGLPLIVWRLVILNQQTRISELKTQIDRETHYTTIFSKSVEQLGQTREVKETQKSNDALELITRTVPNIEVRLGGIHSLNRLAEESVRDRAKIENTLLSYIRENSWSDRTGTSSVRFPNSSLAGASEWEGAYAEGNLTEESEIDLNYWIERSAKEKSERRNWASALPETRVDVNEAIDALAEIKLSPELQKRRLYECLFVGRVFGSEIFRRYTFERCTFARCRFQAPHNDTLTIISSQLVACSLRGGDETSIEIDSCTISGLSVQVGDIAAVSVESSYINDMMLRVGDDSEVDISYSNLHMGSLSAKGSMKFKAEYSAFVDFRFRNMKLTANSSFDQTSFPRSHFYKVDLSQANELSAPALEAAKADRVTRHPNGQPRPNSWPPYSDLESEDEIPF